MNTGPQIGIGHLACKTAYRNVLQRWTQPGSDADIGNDTKVSYCGLGDEP